MWQRPYTHTLRSLKALGFWRKICFQNLEIRLCSNIPINQVYVDSIFLNPASVMKVTVKVTEMEREL